MPSKPEARASAVCAVTVAGLLACGDTSTSAGEAAAADSGATPNGDVRDAGADSGDGAALDTSLPPELARARRVVWVGAHPDDESTAAPLLARLCLAEGVTCTFLVFTRGEGGNCGLSSCAPDLGTFRAAEMVKAASAYRAELVQWDLGNEAANTTEEAAANFAGHAGGTDALVARVKDELDRRRPDALLTFDPRNGVTCHPDHRAAAAVTLLAVRSLAWLSTDRVWMLASRFATDVPDDDLEKASWIGFSPVVSDPLGFSFDANAALPDGSSPWSYLIGNLRAHASQFTPEIVAKFEAAPANRRVVPVLALRDAKDGDKRYETCP